MGLSVEGITNACACPKCGARRGLRCKRPQGMKYANHHERQQVAQQIAKDDPSSLDAIWWNDGDRHADFERHANAGNFLACRHLIKQMTKRDAKQALAILAERGVQEGQKKLAALSASAPKSARDT